MFDHLHFVLIWDLMPGAWNLSVKRIRSLRDLGYFFKIFGRRRRSRLPFERRRFPRVVAGLLAREDRMDHVVEHDEQACGQDPGPDGGDEVRTVEFRKVVV